ncbi:MAG: DUF1992 domain-containing protein [Desulfovibrio sp.]|jgi:hypothetical protein|nr:DUF1992 domain-containing protein [Desulfovibrio sp.]
MISPFSAIQIIAENRIREAQQNGEFDNLPGMGKPLEFEDDSNIPEDLRMAYKILKNAGCLPPEIEERKEINKLADLLENCPDEGERIALARKAQFLIMRLQTRHNRHVRLDENDPYYENLLKKLARNNNEAK